MNISRMRKIDYFVGSSICLALDLLERIKRPFYRRETRREPPHSVLVSKYLGMGSILLATPALHALKRQYPACRIVLLTFEENGSFARKLPVFDAVITIPANPPF
jgi:hypothetical protein